VAPDAPCLQQAAAKPGPACWQHSKEQQHAAGAVTAVGAEDSEPAVAEEDIPSSLWLPEFVGRKAAAGATARQPQQLLKAGHYRRSIAAQGRPSSAAAGLGVGSVGLGSSLLEGLGWSSGSSATSGRPLGGLLQSKTRPSSAAPRLQR
jgi:hypothetical protein